MHQLRERVCVREFSSNGACDMRSNQRCPLQRRNWGQRTHDDEAHISGCGKATEAIVNCAASPSSKALCRAGRLSSGGHSARVD